MENKKQVGRKKLSPQEIKARQEFLLNEPATARTKRVLNPRLKRFLKNFDSLIACAKSPRYTFSEEQSTAILNAISERYTSLESALNGSTKKEIKDIL